MYLTHFEKYKPIEDLLFAPYDLSEWNPGHIEEYLKLLTPQNCYLTLQAKENANQPNM